MAPPGVSSDPSKLINLIIFECFWVRGALGKILTNIVSNYHFWKRPVAGDMTICGLNFLLHVIDFLILIDDFLTTQPPGHVHGSFFGISLLPCG